MTHEKWLDSSGRLILDDHAERALEALRIDAKKRRMAPRIFDVEAGEYFLDAPLVDGLNGGILDGSAPAADTSSVLEVHQKDNAGGRDHE